MVTTMSKDVKMSTFFAEFPIPRDQYEFELFSQEISFCGAKWSLCAGRCRCNEGEDHLSLFLHYNRFADQFCANESSSYTAQFALRIVPKFENAPTQKRNVLKEDDYFSNAGEGLNAVGYQHFMRWSDFDSMNYVQDEKFVVEATILVKKMDYSGPEPCWPLDPTNTNMFGLDNTDICDHSCKKIRLEVQDFLLNRMIS